MRSQAPNLPTRVVNVTVTLRLTPTDQLTLEDPDTWDWPSLLLLDDDRVLSVHITNQRLEYDEGTE